MKMGRPTKYKRKYCNQLIEHMNKGYSFETFGAVIDVNPDTLFEWAKKHKDFSEAKHLAFNKCRLFWEKAGIEGMQNQTYRKGNVSITKSLNAHIWSMNLRARFKEWRNVDKPEVTTTENVASKLVINMPKDE